MYHVAYYGAPLMASRHRTKSCESESPMLAPAPILIPMRMPATVNLDLMAPKSRGLIGVGELLSTLA